MIYSILDCNLEIKILLAEMNAKGSTFERDVPDDVAVRVDDLHGRHEPVDNGWVLMI
jgi:hypothetical protein